MMIEEKIAEERVAAEITIENVSRRGFLRGALGASAFVLCVGKFSVRQRLREALLWILRRPRRDHRFLGVPSQRVCRHPYRRHGLHRCAPVGDGKRRAHQPAAHSGRRTGCRLEPRDVFQGDGDAAYGSQDTDGSHSVREFFDVLREAGATARLMLVRAAAQQWGIPESQCVADPVHSVTDLSAKRKFGYGELAALAATMPVPKKEELKFKSPKDWRYIGKPAPGYDVADVCAGKPCSAWTFASTACSTPPLRIRRCWGAR